MSVPLTIEDMIARYPGTNRQAWAQHRYRGTGPAFFKVGRRVYYRLEDVLAWEENSTRTRTDDPKAAA
ncbi:helix-turn-helix transcriptional regulator [Corynebacterium sp. NPDC060344]|uniref:helix-turn-helix transcriptional regulator n=1 Tax=Corynebacterium sp. NPDC060344 TaxID=3347101 RepID=UPI003652FE26